MFRRRHEERTMTGLAAESAEGGFQRGKIFVAIELSKAKWVVALRVPHLDKVSLFEIAGGDAERLLGLLDRARATVAAQGCDAPETMKRGMMASGSIACWFRGESATACLILQASR